MDSMLRIDDKFVRWHRSELIQRVTMVVAVADELLAQQMINDQTYKWIRRASSREQQMTQLYKALDEGGHAVKSAFYYALKKYEPHLLCQLEGQYVDKERSEFINCVKRVMAVSHKLLLKDAINLDTYSQIRRAGTREDRMRQLYTALDEGGDEVKSVFYSTLRECEPQILDFSEYCKSFHSTSHICDWFIDKHRSELIQRVTMVMPVLYELLELDLLNDQTYERIRRASTSQEQMTEIYKELDEERCLQDVMKHIFFIALTKHESRLLFYLECNPQILQYKTSVIAKCNFFHPLTNERVKLASHYTELMIIQRSKVQTQKYYHHFSPELLSNDKNKSIRIDQLFSPDSDGNTPKTVILRGDSGAGKSFMLQKIMLDWASGELYSEEFNIVYLLKCDELKFICEWISLYDVLNWSSSLTSKQMLDIHELGEEKVLILIDGIDEFSFDPHIKSSHHPDRVTDLDYTAPVTDTVIKLLNGEILPESFLLVTTRSDTNTLINLVKDPQRFTEVVGFSERGVQEYFQNFFQDEQLFRKTYENVKRNETLLTHCFVPLLCWMVCCYLKKHFRDDDHEMTELKTTTSIYVNFVSTVLEDQSHSVLRSLGQLAEEGVLDEVVLFDETLMFETGVHADISKFLHKDLYLRDSLRKTVQMKFTHLSFQEFFMALYYVFLNEEQSLRNIRDTLVAEKVKARLSNPISSVLLFLCGLSNEDTTEQKYKWTVPKIIRKEMESTILTLQDEDKLLALRCLYELQDDEFTKSVLLNWVSVDLSDVPLSSTDCWVLLYCLQLCPHIRDLNLMYCELTADKLKILQPVLHLCTLWLSVEHLSEVGNLIQNLEGKILKELKVQEDEISASASPRWALDLSMTNGDVLVSLSSSETNPSCPAVLKISLTCPQSQMSSTDWTLFLQRICKARKLPEDSSALDYLGDLLLSSIHSVVLKTLDLKVVSLNESWAYGIISLIEICTSLQQLSVSVTGLLLEEGLALLNKSLTNPHCTVSIKGRMCSKPTDQCREQDWSHSCNEMTIHFKQTILDKLEEPTISEPESFDLNPQLLPVCQSCVHIADSDQWVQVEPTVCRDEEFRISTPAGRFECSRTRMRWVCAGDVTLQYRTVDGHFLNAELERLQLERIGPVIDVTVISGKLEEAHLPHYACLAESDPSLTDAVKLLSVEDGGFILESVELTRFHAKILQPAFSHKTLLMKLGISVKVHCDLLIFMIQKKPIILHVYFLPLDSFFKEQIKKQEKSNHQIMCSRPETPLQMMKQHSLEVLGAVVQPRAIMLRGDKMPNFFEVKQNVYDDINMTLRRVHDQKQLWTTSIWKELTNIKPSKSESNLVQTGQKKKLQVSYSFDKATYFDSNWSDLIKIVTNVNAVADRLLHKEIINEELYSQITQPHSTSEDNMRKICSIVRKGSIVVKEIFISILLEENPNLINHLPLSDF